MDKNQSSKADIVAVAKAAKVSPSTVSRAFNHPELVRLTTRKKIERAVEKLGYIRNRAAQAMHGKRSGTIGVLVPTINHAIFSEVIQAFSDAVDEAGFTILLASHGFDLEREYRVLRKFLEHRVDGIALIGLDHREATFNLIEQQAVPALAIWNYDANSRVSCIGAENTQAGRLAAQHLIDLGHRDIALVFPATEENDRARGRLIGAQEVFRANGCALAADRQTETLYSIAHAKRDCLKLLDTPSRPTALLCGNDVIAQGAVYAAHQLGLSVPLDISIIGIGDFKGSGDIEPALTTISIPADRIGALAGQQMVESIASGAGPIERVRCDVACVIRDTTGVPFQQPSP